MAASCLSMDCSSVRGPLPTDSPLASLARKGSYIEAKSQQRDRIVPGLPGGSAWSRGSFDIRLDHIDNKLTQQQAVLEKVVSLQQDLRSFMEIQQEAMGKKIDLMGVGSSLGGSPLGRPMRLQEVAPYGQLIGNEKMMPEDVSPTSSMQERGGRRGSISDSQRNSVNEGNVDENMTLKKSRKSRRSVGVHGVQQKLLAQPSSIPQIYIKRDNFIGKLVTSTFFEMLMGGVIIANFIVIFLELEWRGYHTAYSMGLLTTDPEWEEVVDYFSITEKVFNCIYLSELVLRVYGMRKHFCKDFLNVCDTLVVMVSCIDSFIFDPIVKEGGSSKGLSLVRSIIRILRAFRVVRFIRILRFMQMFSALRVLIKTLSMSLDSLLWSMVVVAFIIFSAAMMMVQLTAPYLEDETKSMEQREWVYMHYGSALRASYTMFEATFSAKWATHVGRPLMENINPWFSVFWVSYTVTVNFAVIRIIAALFLKQTMAVAAIDAEHKAVERLRERDKTMGKLREIFKMGDVSGDGVLHKWEFEQMMKNTEVLKMCDELELDQLDLHLLFDLLCEDDGVADQEEFLTGAIKLQNQARTVDMIQVLHEQTVMRRSLEIIKDGLERVDTVLHPEDPWKAKRDHGDFIFSITGGNGVGAISGSPLAGLTESSGSNLNRKLMSYTGKSGSIK